MLGKQFFTTQFFSSKRGLEINCQSSTQLSKLYVSVWTQHFLSTYCANLHHILDYPITPGSTFYLYLNSVDVVGTPVASFLYSFPRSAGLSDHVQLDVNQEVRRLPGFTTCSRLDFRVFAENITLFIDLYATIGGQKVTVEVTTTACPPGFLLGSSQGKCVCVVTSSRQGWSRLVTSLSTQ